MKVTPVQNQGECGSSPYFSAVAAIETNNAMKHIYGVNNLYALSVQQIIDCSTQYGNYGCNGGLMRATFNYTIDTVAYVYYQIILILHKMVHVKYLNYVIIICMME